MAAKRTDPAVGASTWASGSHVCTGHIGVFTAKELKKANHNKFWYLESMPISYNFSTSVVPEIQYIEIIATSIKTDPSKVYKKNLNAE